jgi:hypothetical protein
MLSALVVPWSHVLYGSIIGPVVGTTLLWLLRERHKRTLAITAVGVFSGTWLWNLMLNIRHAGIIDGDIPFRLFPISWQDTGTGLFSFAVATALLLATTHRNEVGHRTLKIAGIASTAALLIDIYTW